MKIMWKWFPDGKYPQACCSCGRTIPASNPRYWVTTDSNPLSRATIRHQACSPAILYDSHGKRISLKYPETVETEL